MNGDHLRAVEARDPHVTVVLPTYNRADILPDSIESVLEQTYEDFELIVVDDGSSDETGQVVDGFDDPRLRYIRHETNQGISAARNTGIAHARGDIVAFQDSDDEWLPDKLRRHVEAFDDAPPEVGVVYTGMYREVDGDERYLPPPEVEPKVGKINDVIVRRNFISTQMAAVRRECFDTVGGFDEELTALVDWELWIRLSQQYQFELVDEALVRAAVEPDSISKNLTGIVESRERIVEKHYDRFDTASLANHLFFIGHGAMKTGDVQKGRRYLWKAVRTEPRTKYLLASVLSRLGARPYGAIYKLVKSARNR